MVRCSCPAARRHARSPGSITDLPIGNETIESAKKMPADKPDLNLDPLLAQARQLIVDHQNPSVAFLQRHLRLGYQRALDLMQCLEGEVVTAPQSDGWRRMLHTNKESNDKMDSE